MPFFERQFFTRMTVEGPVPNLTDELRTAKERRLNQFGTAKALSSTESAERLSNLT